MTNVLIVNSTEIQCGVHQYGKRIYQILYNNRTEFDYPYITCNSTNQFWDTFEQYNPKVVLFNYHPSTMPWVTHNLLGKIKVPKLALFHEVPITGFDHLIHLDPNYIPKDGEFSTPRPLFSFSGPYAQNEVPTFGSFGFGFGNKGFPEIVTRVQEEYDNAVIRFHIPFAKFGDEDGSGAKSIADVCRSRIHKSGVRLEITHDFMDEEKLLDFLASNDMNCFFFHEMYGRGISSSTDYALSVNRPIAITKSYMFRHIRDTVPSICVEDASLKDILKNGPSVLDYARQQNSQENLIFSYERIFASVI